MFGWGKNKKTFSAVPMLEEKVKVPCNEINTIEDVAEREKKAAEFCKAVKQKLLNGWNPFKEK